MYAILQFEDYWSSDRNISGFISKIQRFCVFQGVTSLNYKIFFSNVTQLTDAVVSFDLLECHFKKENVRTMTSRAKNWLNDKAQFPLKSWQLWPYLRHTPCITQAAQWCLQFSLKHSQVPDCLHQVAYDPWKAEINFSLIPILDQNRSRKYIEERKGRLWPLWTTAWFSYLSNSMSNYFVKISVARQFDKKAVS